MSEVRERAETPVLIEPGATRAPSTGAPLGEESPRRSRRRALPPTLAAADAVALSSAYLVAAVAADGVLGLAGLGVLAALLGAWVVVAQAAGLYNREWQAPDHSTVDEAVRLFALLSCGAWLVIVGYSPFTEPPVVPIVIFWCAALPFVFVSRGIARGVVRQSRANVQRAIIVGAGDIGQLVARKLMQHPEYRIDVVGFADDQPKRIRRDVADVPLLGSPSELPQLIAAHDIDRAIFAFTNDSHNSFLDTIRSLEGADVEIDVVPRLFEVMTPIADVRTVEGIPLLGFTPRTVSPTGRLLKRGLDLVGSLLILFIVAPVFLVVTIAIKLDSRGPVFFRQERLGAGMHPFTMLKFRTMRVDTDTSVHQNYVKTIMDTGTSPDAGNLYKLYQAQYVTATGRVLRRLSLDELPQFINVLRGDMSLVGPRPCLRYETELFEPHHFVRFSVPAGVTGLWQVTARAKTTFKEALDLDVTYVRSWSFGLDLRLLARTPLKTLKSDSTA